MPTVEFSLAGGSVLLKRLQRSGLLGWVPQNLKNQIVLVVLIAWLPLLVLTALNGVALGNKVRIPFLLDLVQYARFMVALPCTIAMGAYINPRLEKVLNSFVNGGIVTRKDFSRFETIVARARTLTGSMTVELVLVGLVYTFTSLGLHRDISSNVSTWHHFVSSSFMSKATAGWFLWVSMPLLLFGWLLWMWRLAIWFYVLLRISRLDLRVVATHPDHVGGLNFVNVGVRRFSLLVFAVSSILSASIGDEILFNGASVRSFELELTLFFLICLVVTVGPLLVFTPTLVRAKLGYWGNYGPFAGKYVQSFDEKWIAHSDYAPESVLGTPDIQSLADLQHSYASISEMRAVLPNRMTIGIFVLSYVVPAIPLLMSVISLRSILSELYSLLLK